MPGFKKVKKEAWRFYNAWRKEKTYCPALDCKIHITLRGWNHITKRTRKHTDLYRRLKLLPYAKKLIKKSTTIQETLIDKHGTYYILEEIINIKDGNFDEIIKVRVVIIEDKYKKKTFLSIMGRKRKKK